jgi:hypothetical protein
MAATPARDTGVAVGRKEESFGGDRLKGLRLRLGGCRGLWWLGGLGTQL